MNMEIVLTINKETVYEEVAKTTEYTGAKMDDEHAYETISTTEEDKSILERFWNECKNMVCNSLKKVLISEEETNGEYSLTLGLSTAFDDSLTAYLFTSSLNDWGLITSSSEPQDNNSCTKS